MEQRKQIKSSTWWSIALKLLIAVLALLFIYLKVIKKESIYSLITDYQNILQSAGTQWMVLFVFALMILNWSIEALKWKWMMQKLEVVPFSRALKAVFSGLTISFFTPNRIGEYGGRIFHLRTADRIKATLITIFENVSQLIVTIFIGSLSLIFYLYEYVELHRYLLWVIAVLMVVFAAVIVLLFLELPLLDSFVLKTKWLRRITPYLEVLSSYKKSELLVLLDLALLRYIIFTFQFFLLLKIFGVHTGYPATILLINMVFFVMTLVPTFALTELGVRGAVATFFLAEVTNDSLAILNATVSLWIINLVIPALTGVIFIFQFRFNKTPV